MMKKQKDADRLAEEIMRAFGKELGEARADFCAALMDPDREDPPMYVDAEKLPWDGAAWDGGAWEGEDDLDDGLDAWDGSAGTGDDDWDLPPAAEIMDFSQWKEIQTDVHRKRKGRGGKLRRVLILAAVLILMMSLALAAAEGVKLKRSSMRMQDTPNESTRLIDMDNSAYDVDDFRVTYVPEGFELVEDVKGSKDVRMIRYYSEAKGGLQIHIMKTEVYGANVDNERAGRKEVLVNDKQAYVFEDQNTGFIFWQVGDCTVDITANLTEEELIRIASQIFVQ